MESGEDSSFEEEHKVIDLPQRSPSQVDEEYGPHGGGMQSKSSASPRGNDMRSSEGRFGGIGQAGSLARFVKKAPASTGGLPPSLTVQQFLHPALNVSRFLTDFRLVSRDHIFQNVPPLVMCADSRGNRQKECLGKGGFGAVFRVYHSVSDKVYTLQPHALSLHSFEPGGYGEGCMVLGANGL